MNGQLPLFTHIDWFLFGMAVGAVLTGTICGIAIMWS